MTQNYEKDANKGTLPFQITVPVIKYVLEAGKKAVKYTMGFYHLCGFTKGKGHAKLLQIKKECGKYDPDILPDLYNANATDTIEEYENLVLKKVDHLYWNDGQLSIVK